MVLLLVFCMPLLAFALGGLNQPFWYRSPQSGCIICNGCKRWADMIKRSCRGTADEEKWAFRLGVTGFRHESCMMESTAPTRRGGVDVVVSVGSWFTPPVIVSAGPQFVSVPRFWDDGRSIAVRPYTLQVGRVDEWMYWCCGRSTSYLDLGNLGTTERLCMMDRDFVGCESITAGWKSPETHCPCSHEPTNTYLRLPPALYLAYGAGFEGRSGISGLCRTSIGPCSRVIMSLWNPKFFYFRFLDL